MIHTSIDLDWDVIEARLAPLATKPHKRVMLSHLLAGARADALVLSPGALVVELVSIAVALAR